jgi:hypothetical protein
MIYTHSLGLQAIVERNMADNGDGLLAEGQFGLNFTDHGFVQDVVTDSLETLKIGIRAAESQHLNFAPVRLFLRVTTASVFLLNALGLGVSTNRLHDALTVLKHVIAALKVFKPDDLHLGARYATLLEMYVARLHDKFVPPHEAAVLRIYHAMSYFCGQWSGAGGFCGWYQHRQAATSTDTGWQMGHIGMNTH